jgi:hypothetical protein
VVSTQSTTRYGLNFFFFFFFFLMSKNRFIRYNRVANLAHPERLEVLIPTSKMFKGDRTIFKPINSQLYILNGRDALF